MVSPCSDSVCSPSCSALRWRAPSSDRPGVSLQRIGSSSSVLGRLRWDLLLACVNDDETLLMLIFCTEAEGLTLDDVQEILSEDGTVSLYGVTIINGVETVYALGEEDGTAYVAYFHVSGAALTQFMFWYMDEEAANLSGEIMATLRTE